MARDVSSAGSPFMHADEQTRAGKCFASVQEADGRDLCVEGATNRPCTRGNVHERQVVSLLCDTINKLPSAVVPLCPPCVCACKRRRAGAALGVGRSNEVERDIHVAVAQLLSP